MNKTKILVVEDERITAKDMQISLQNLGYCVPAVVSSGEEALKKTEELKPDLVLMDIMLQGKMDGIEAADQIRSRFNIPVIYVTAYFDENRMERAKRTEPFGYIIKPFQDKELKGVIEMALYKHRMGMELKRSEAWFSTTLRSIGDAVIATDRKGQIIFMNPVAEALTGWKQKDALGKPLKNVFEIINEKTGKPARNPVARVLREGVVVGLANHTVLITKGGKQVPIRDSGAPIKDDKGNIAGVVLVFRDVTEHKQSEDKIKHLNSVLNAIRRVNQLVTQVKDRDILIKSVCDALIKTRGYYSAWIVLLDDDRRFVTAAESGLGKDFLPIVDQFKRGKLTACGRKSLSKPGVIITENPVSTCIDCPLSDKFSNCGVMTIRLEHGGKVYGLLSVSVPTEFVTDKEEQSLFKEVSGDIAFALYRIELEEKRKQAEEALRKSEKDYQNLFEYRMDGLIVHRLIEDENGKPVDCLLKKMNTAAEEILSWKRENIEGKRATEVYGGDTPFIERYAKVAQTGKAEYFIDYYPGFGKWYEIMSFCPEKGYFANAFRDITERKRAEEQIQKNLQEKNVLLKEIHHRVKNNLQIVCSLLNLQSRYIKNEEAIKMFRESRDRVRSMALVHETLYGSKDLAKIDFAGYIKNLAQGLYRAYGIDPGKIVLSLSVKDIHLGINIAVPCGLLINELISNALKHAFPPSWEGKGEIEVSIHPTEGDEIELTVSDNGVGMPEDLDIHKTKSLGMHLVTILAEDQLDGKIKLDRKRGTKFQIKFKS